MTTQYSEIRAFVQHLTPTWRKTQHENFARVIAALLERPSLVLSELARAMPRPDQPLHGRLKRLDRFLDNPRLDEAALSIRWLHLAYRFGETPPQPPEERPILPVLLDTVYFEPFAMLVSTVPCGSRGLPIALTTYHRSSLEACLPPRSTWPDLEVQINPPRPRRGHRPNPASSVPRLFLSQNLIEEELIDYVFSLISPALWPVLVADRGFARADLFRQLQADRRDFVIRIDAQTHVRLPKPLGAGRPIQDTPARVLGIEPGQRLWCPEAYYGADDRVPIRLLAVWEEGQQEPWYLATMLDSPQLTELLYRWRMRLECANRDEKTGVLLREGGDAHALRSVLHLHRLLLALCCAEWLCALVGLQAWRDLPALLPLPTKKAETQALPAQGAASPALPSPPFYPLLPAPAPPNPTAPELSKPMLPSWAKAPSLSLPGPSMPPPVVPHRGESPRLPRWMRPFAARGMLSYVRLGLEVLRCEQLLPLLHRLVDWLGGYLWTWTPCWPPWQLRYRLKHWWCDSS
jgi:hypothetical protein